MRAYSMVNSQPIANSTIKHKYDQYALLQQLEALNQQDTSHDPVRLRFIQSLIHRGLKQRETVRARLLHKAQYELDEYSKALKAQSIEGLGGDARSKSSSSIAIALAELRHILNQDVEAITESDYSEYSEYGEYGEYVSNAETSLTLIPTVVDAEGTDITDRHPLPRLKSGVAYQKRQHQQRVDHFIDSAFNETPENPGPLNPETLAIKLLRQINHLSPAYISRYVPYFDTLQWLEQEMPSSPKKKK